jgi:hypothetical protein
MFAVLIRILEVFAKGGVSAFLVNAGLTVVAFTGIELLVSSALDYVVDTFNNIATDLLQVILLAGFAESFSIIASAILTRVALTQAMNTFRLGRAST